MRSVVAGDLYDKAVPSAEAVEVFDRFIAGLSERLPEASVMLISGNHDSGSQDQLFPKRALPAECAYDRNASAKRG